VVSVRTVDNHLQNVYTKLGVTGRAELADALRRVTGGTARDRS
jgi:DNA-binding CsgD family transcriptional regulator